MSFEVQGCVLWVLWDDWGVWLLWLGCGVWLLCFDWLILGGPCLLRSLLTLLSSSLILSMSSFVLTSSLFSVWIVWGLFCGGYPDPDPDPSSSVSSSRLPSNFFNFWRRLAMASSISLTFSGRPGGRCISTCWGICSLTSSTSLSGPPCV